LTPLRGLPHKRIEAAVVFANKVIEDHHSVTDDDFKTLNVHFTEQEMAALCAYIAFIGGANRFGAMVGLTHHDADQ
jgi:alkylhydroperoxidase family enzyme